MLCSIILDFWTFLEMLLEMFGSLQKTKQTQQQLRSHNWNLILQNSIRLIISGKSNVNCAENLV